MDILVILSWSVFFVSAAYAYYRYEVYRTRRARIEYWEAILRRYRDARDSHAEKLVELDGQIATYNDVLDNLKGRD